MSLLLFLSEFNFSTRGDNLDRLKRQTKARLAPQALLQRVEPVQFLGPGARTISIEATIRPEYQGGLGQIDAIHDAADDGIPRVLVTGYGAYLGLFLISSVSDDWKYIVAAGIPRKITFKIDLLRAPEDGGLFSL